MLWHCWLHERLKPVPLKRTWPQRFFDRAVMARKPNGCQLILVYLELLLLLHLFNGLFSGTTWVSRYQKGKTSLGLNEARHQHLVTQFFYRPDVLPAAQPTMSMHWKHAVVNCKVIYKTRWCVCVIEIRCMRAGEIVQWSTCWNIDWPGMQSVTQYISHIVTTQWNNNGVGRVQEAQSSRPKNYIKK